MLNKFTGCFIAATVFYACSFAQDAQTPSPKPTEHVLGSITNIDAAAHTITVKVDGGAGEQTVLLANTKTLIKVAPGAKDLKGATKITGDDLAVGDRIDVRGSKAADDATQIAARVVILMSGRDLQRAHQMQAAEWQGSTAGIVTSVDSSSGKIGINARTPEGRKPVSVDTTAQTEFTRYSPDTPTTPVRSQVAQIQVGDQVRVLGSKSEDGATIAATKIYSGAFRTLNGTVASIAPDGKQLIIRDLATKQPTTVEIADNTSIHKLPPEMAAGLARGPGSGAHPSSASPAASPTGAAGPPAEEAPRPRPRGGDISRMIERLPKIAIADLKAGDAVVVSGAAMGTDGTRIAATYIIAGVEPILQAAPARARGGQAAGGDWGLGEISVPQ